MRSINEITKQNGKNKEWVPQLFGSEWQDICGSSAFSSREKTVFFLRRTYFQWVLLMEKSSHGRVVPCPGKRPFASPKKAVVPLFLMRASAVCSPAISFPRVSLRRGNLRTLERFDPGFFWLRRLPFYPDNEKTGLNDQPNFKRSILADIPP